MIALELQNFKKYYGTCRANDGLSLRVQKGSLHALVGENGAGKSTAMKILFGMDHADEGEILVNGKTVSIRSPQDAVRLGIGMVHQHFMFSGRDDAIDNLLLTDGLRNKSFFLSRSKVQNRVSYLASRYGLKLETGTAVETWPIGLQQRLEILKLLYQESNILILDEPTAVLTPMEKDRFFEDLRRMKESGKTIVLITHKLKEVLSVADEVTVIRNGKTVETAQVKDIDQQWLANRMVGRSVKLQPVERKSFDSIPDARDQLEIDFHGKKVSIRSHEIVGIAGVEGNGQKELMSALQSRAEAQGWSIGWIPQDRLYEGLLVRRSAQDNFLLGQSRERRFLDRFGFLKMDLVRNATRHGMEKLDVRPADPDVTIGSFSGGNQQKLVFARELSREPKVWLIQQPTRGVDVGAIELIYERLLELREQGARIVVVSSELDELLNLSDRLLVMFDGKIAGEWKRGVFQESVIGSAMGGVS